MKESFRFIYRDARGNITVREVVAAIPVGDNYLQCFDAGENHMRTYRRDRVLELITDQSEECIEERLKWFRDNSPPPLPKGTLGKRGKWNSESSPEVCLTGFKKDDKSRLTQLAESAGLYVAGRVTNNLKILVCGYNAGPVKKQRAQVVGAMVLSESQFIEYVETGEIAEEGIE